MDGRNPSVSCDGWPHAPETSALPFGIHRTDLQSGNDHPDARHSEFRTGDVAGDDAVESVVGKRFEDDLDVLEDIVGSEIGDILEVDLPLVLSEPHVVDLLDLLVSHVLGHLLELGVDLHSVFVGGSALSHFGDRPDGCYLGVQMGSDTNDQQFGIFGDGIVRSRTDRGDAEIRCEVLEMDVDSLILEFPDELCGNRVRIAYEDIRVRTVPEFGDGPGISLDIFEQCMEDGLLHGVPRGDTVGVVSEELEFVLFFVGIIRVVDCACGHPCLASPEHLVSVGPCDDLVVHVVECPHGEDEIPGIDDVHRILSVLLVDLVDYLLRVLVGLVHHLVGIAEFRRVSLDGFHDCGCFRLFDRDSFPVVVLGFPESGLLTVDGENGYSEIVLVGDVLRFPQSCDSEEREHLGQRFFRRFDSDSGLWRTFGTGF